MPRVIAVGASQGGVDALRTVASGLPQDFPGTLLVVLHVGEGSILPALLNEVGPIHASHARDGERMHGGRIYVAPPDHHMLLIDGKLELTRGPRENWARPAIDPLFRSLAEHRGHDAVGVVLTGRLNDGTAGLYEIKRRGGVAIVQDPNEAEASAMPESARRNVSVDFVLKLKEIPPLLDRLAREKGSTERGEHGVGTMEERPEISRPTAQSCPECGGAMAEEKLGTLTQFRCHIGHVMTAEVMAAAQVELLEKALAIVMRRLNERSALCREIAEQHTASGNAEASALWAHAADEASVRERALIDMQAMRWAHPEIGNRGD